MQFAISYKFSMILLFRIGEVSNVPNKDIDDTRNSFILIYGMCSALSPLPGGEQATSNKKTLAQIFKKLISMIFMDCFLSSPTAGNINIIIKYQNYVYFQVLEVIGVLRILMNVSPIPVSMEYAWT